MASTTKKSSAIEQFTVSISNKLSEDEQCRLKALVASKHSLLCSAFNVKDVPVEVTKDKISFPWFPITGEDGEAEAYTQFIEAIVKMAKELKRITAKDKKEENEKFAMRMFTVRLGLKGDKYKLLRKLLSKNLTGNSAWSKGAPPEKKDKPVDTEKKVAKKGKQPAKASDKSAKPPKPKKEVKNE